MSTISAETSRFNVEATLNSWLLTTVNDYDKPTWMGDISFVFDMPDTELPTPAISLHHIPIDTEPRWQGNNVGTGNGYRASAFMEINLWVSKTNPNWMAQLRTMQSMVEHAAINKVVVMVRDYYSNPVSPTLMGYKVNIGALTGRETQPDKNPNIERRRLLLLYDWIIRV